MFEKISVISFIALGYSYFILSNSFTQISFLKCIFKCITGYPCPGCGMGRATIALINGDILLSLSYNILCIPFSTAIIIILIWLSLDLVRHKNTFFKFVSDNVNNTYNYILITTLIINWTINMIRL